MRKSRLFPSLVLFGASLTGGAAVATVATVSLAVVGCDDDTTGQRYPDIGVGPMDMHVGSYPDIGVPWLPDLAKGD
jgi:hypothetical protein